MAKDKDDTPQGSNRGPKKTGKFELTGEDRYLWDFVTRSIRPLDPDRKTRVLPEPKPVKSLWSGTLRVKDPACQTGSRLLA